MIKISLVIIILCAVSLIYPLGADAHEGYTEHPHPEQTKTLRAMASNSAALKSATTKVLSSTRKQRVLSEIDRRIALLNEAAKKVDGLTHITPTEKSTLLNQIQTSITSLQTLKTNINGSVTDANLAADISTLVITHKNFSVALPQIRLLIAAELMDTIANRMLEIVKKIEVRVATANSAGENTTTTTNLILNLKAKLADVKAQSNSITASITPLASDSETSRATLKTAQGKLKIGMQNLRSASQDLKVILQDLKNITSKGTKSATPSAQ